VSTPCLRTTSMHVRQRQRCSKWQKQLPMPPSLPDWCRPPPISRTKLANWLSPQAPSPLTCSTGIKQQAAQETPSEARPPNSCQIGYGSKADVGQSQCHVRFGQKRQAARSNCMSGLPPKADIRLKDRHVCQVPGTDSCTAAKRHIYSITLSALVSSAGGTVRLSAFAVLRFMMN
jgi:hypothetical protein